VHTGLWEAVEELRLAKSGLEIQLQEAESRARDLQAQLLQLQPQGSSATPTSATPTSTVSEQSVVIAPAQTPEQAVTRIQELRPAASPTPAMRQRMEALRSENEELRRECAVMGKRLRSTAPEQERPNPVVMQHVNAAAATVRKAAEEAAATKRADEEARSAELLETVRRENAKLLETVRRENEEIRSERDSLLERLDIFERALQVETPEPPDVPMPGDEAGNPNRQGMDKLGHKLEKLHSQYVMEVLDLRKELGGLKKKKWVLQSVIARGGEREGDAIEHDLAELRRTSAEFRRKSDFAHKENEVRGADKKMLVTR